MKRIRGGSGDGENAAQFGSGAGQGGGGKIAAVGEAAAAANTGPETAIGKAIVGNGAVEKGREGMAGDVSDERDMAAGGPQGMMAIESAEMAVIPGTEQDRAEMSLVTAEGLEDGGKLFGQDEEAAVGGRVLVTDGADEAIGGDAGVGDARGEPGGVDFGEETGDLPPTGSLAGFAGLADEDDEKVEAVAGGGNGGMRSGAEKIPESGEELEENAGWVGLGVGFQGADDLAGETVERGFGKLGPEGGRGFFGREWVFVDFGEVGEIGWFGAGGSGMGREIAEEFPGPALDVVEGWQWLGGRDVVGICSHAGKVARIRVVDKGWRAFGGTDGGVYLGIKDCSCWAG